MDNIFIKLIASHSQAFGNHDSAQGNNRHFGSSSANINNKIAPGFLNLKPGANSSCHWLFNQENLAGAGISGRIFDCLFLNFSHSPGNADNYPWPDKIKLALLRLINKIAEHLLGHLKIRDNSFD